MLDDLNRERLLKDEQKKTCSITRIIIKIKDLEEVQE